MAILVHKAVADTGGAIGDEISSGVVAELLPEITLAQQLAGVIINRKFYIKNTGAVSKDITVTLGTATVFTTIIFEATDDAEVVGDLTGSETNESPISVTVASGAWTSFWLRVTVPALSTETDNYNTVAITLNY